MNPALADDIVGTLTAYEQLHGPPSGRADFLRSGIDAGRPLTNRKDVPIHVTCGVIARHPDGRVLQIHHRALDRWLFPGGHLEPDDASLTAAALRELAEETGLTTANDHANVRPVPIDIDIHAIPANPRKGEPDHYHADFRYVVQVTDDAIHLQTDEVTAWRWADPSQIDNPRLTERLQSL